MDLLEPTFEDKRKHNFLQGQVELERRKQELAEKMRREEEAREMKEREEWERQDQIRQEKERERQLEAERQVQRQRQIEAQRAAKRQSAVEARLQAFKEAEHQRYVQLERQRVEHLQKEKAREQALLEQSKAHRASLLENASGLASRSADHESQLTQAQAEVDRIKMAIGELRSHRDAYDLELRELTEQVEAAKAELMRWQREKEQLSLRVFTGVDVNQATEQLKTLAANKEVCFYLSTS
ncbi:unnamed protein product [Protopolystoma xenopodis]|uniref:Uncharacterized protein n=1 Tax=Protopolystoma xenopodis TaxID=117903 RepID=A0A448WSI5_9PLAT|nr:unnamed protein product [Protopolystoma xenopodis]